MASVQRSDSDVPYSSLANDCHASVADELHLRVMGSLESLPAFRSRSERGEIFVQAEGDTVIISGKVSSFYVKQLFQETLRQVRGVARITNQIKVVDSQESAFAS